MTTLQLVRRRSHEGVVEAGVVPSPPNADPFSFLEKGQGPWLLGSESLLHLATALVRLGYTATHVTLHEVHGTSVHDDENDEYSEEIVHLINSGNETDLDQYMDVDLASLRVVSVDLRGRQVTQGQISLREHGIVITYSRWQAEHLEEVIRAAMANMR